jgi:hypothetical protein
MGSGAVLVTSSGLFSHAASDRSATAAAAIREGFFIAGNAFGQVARIVKRFVI